jgi:hypothetical protein
MAGQSIRAATSYVCACCGAPLAMAAQDLKAWRVGAQFVCNEFCADGIPSPGNSKQKAERLVNVISDYNSGSCRLTP